MNTCKEIPYEELNAIQVSTSFGHSYPVVIIISPESQRPTWKKLLYKGGLLCWASG
jgi:hypothetical protein